MKTDAAMWPKHEEQIGDLTVGREAYSVDIGQGRRLTSDQWVAYRDGSVAGWGKTKAEALAMAAVDAGPAAR